MNANEPPYYDYLGDGVYAHYDAYHIVLEANGHGAATTDRIALEPAVLEALKRYEVRLRSMLDEKHS